MSVAPRDMEHDMANRESEIDIEAMIDGPGDRRR
jgi:hypothetical protein